MDFTTATLAELREKLAQLAPGTDEFNVIANRIAELESQLDPQEAEEDLVTKRANEEIAIFGMPLGAFLDSEVAHLSIRKVVLPVVYKLSSDLEIAREEANEKETAAAEEIDQLNVHLQERDAEISRLKSALFESQMLADDNATKRDNASNELLEAKVTIDQLNDKINALTVAVPKIRTNVEGPVEVVEKKKREIYDVEYLGINKNRYKAKYADTDESFEDYTVYKDAKYTEVTAEQAIPFRTAYLEAHTVPVEDDSNGSEQGNSVEEQPVTAPPYPTDSTESSTEADSAEPGLAEESPAVAGSTVTREEFEALVYRVATVEANQSIGATYKQVGEVA